MHVGFRLRHHISNTKYEIKHMNIFKYLGIAASKFFLENSTMRFSQPKALNDPFELRPQFYCNKDDLGGINSFNTRFVLFGHGSVVMNYMSKLGDFGDDGLMVDINNQLRQLNDTLGVLCLTRDYRIAPMNLLMWAHYSESHAGIAVKFKSDSSIVMNSHAVHYVKTRPIISAKIFRENEYVSIGDVFFKSDIWKYESEIRFSKKIEDCGPSCGADIFGNPIYTSEVNLSDIDAVYVGVNASDEIKNMASIFHKSTGIDVIYLSVAKESFDLIPFKFDTRRPANEMIDIIYQIHKGNSHAGFNPPPV